ncbi:MAG: C10 family peptidase [Candidatus Zixiibacteriota bacterium]
MTLRKQISTFLLFFIAISIVQCEPVPWQKAIKTAENHLILQKRKDFAIDIGQYHSDSSGTRLYYLFIVEPKGYIAVSADDRMPPILAFSFTGNYFNFHGFKKNKNSKAKYLFDKISQNYYSTLDKIPQDIIEDNKALWENYSKMHNNFILDYFDFDQYGPWLNTEWNQGEPYNEYCPRDPSTWETSVAGCVPVALGQILNYWEFPYNFYLDDSDSYSSSRTSPPISVNGSDANMDTIEYNGPHIFGPTNDQIARLLFACGVSVGAQYSSEATSGNCSDSWFEEKGFSGATMMFQPDIDWEEVENSMISGKVAYTAVDGEEGHAIVTDGYRESGEYHLNMGWGGHEDGWFNIRDDFLPSGFTNVSQIIINATAPEHLDIPNTHLEATNLDIEINLRKTINGISDSDIDWYSFHGSCDSIYIFETYGPHTMQVDLYDETGFDLLRSSSEMYREGHRNAFVTFIPPDDGFYKIKVTATETYDDVNYKMSYNRASPARISLLAPSGGEEFTGCYYTRLYWNQSGQPTITHFAIDFSQDGPDGPWINIADSIVGNSYNWRIPTIEEDSDNCYIKIYDPYGGYAHAMNSEPFTVISHEAVVEFDIEIAGKKVSLFPNPFRRVVHFEVPENMRFDGIYDISGKLIETNLSGTSWIPGMNIEAGIYFAVFEDLQGKRQRYRLSYIK